MILQYDTLNVSSVGILQINKVNLMGYRKLVFFYKLFEFSFESISAIRNNEIDIIFSSKYHSYYCIFWEVNQVQLVYLHCCISTQSAVQIKEFHLLDYIVCRNPQKREKELTNKKIKHKLGGSSKMYLFSFKVI